MDTEENNKQRYSYADYMNEGTTYEVIYGKTKVPVQMLEGLIIDLEELFKD